MASTGIFNTDPYLPAESLMDSLYNALTAPGFRNAIYALSVTCIMLAVGVVLIAFAFYGRTRETENASPENVKWVLLLATWRDSLIITLLFTAEGLSYRYSEFYGLSEVGINQIYSLNFIITPMFSMVVYVLIFVVTAMRIIAITRWLSSQSVNGA